MSFVSVTVIVLYLSQAGWAFMVTGISINFSAELVYVYIGFVYLSIVCWAIKQL